MTLDPCSLVHATIIVEDEMLVESIFPTMIYPSKYTFSLSLTLHGTFEGSVALLPSIDLLIHSSFKKAIQTLFGINY